MAKRLYHTQYFSKNAPLCTRKSSSSSLTGAIRAAAVRVLLGQWQSATIYHESEMVALIQNKSGNVSIAVSRRELLIKHEAPAIHSQLVQPLQDPFGHSGQHATAGPH